MQVILKLCVCFHIHASQATERPAENRMLNIKILTTKDEDGFYHSQQAVFCK